MSADRILALRAQRRAVLEFCRGLTADQWHTPSRASGWLVRDVIAHMGASCRVIWSRQVVDVLQSADTERDNEALVQNRRTWPINQVIGEFARWSRVTAAAMNLAARGPMNTMTVRSGSLGRYPAWLLPSTLVFDWHVHLWHDIAPAVDKPAPPTDARRLTATLEWMLAGLEQMNRDKMGWVDRPLTLSLAGPGGGTWTVAPAGDGLLRVTPGRCDAAAATVAGESIDFPAWATARTPWRTVDLGITGDDLFASRFLDAVNII